MAALILDACALIAYLRDEVGGKLIEEVLRQRSDTVLMHAVNAGEVYYDGLRRSDPAIGDFWKDVATLGIEIRRDLDDEFVTSAAQWKAKHRMAYADAFALALTQRESGTLATTDHKELDPVSAEGVLRFMWLR